MRVCVYCASSDAAHPEFRSAARRLGERLAEGGCTVVYGGGSAGSMGALAEGALSRGGEVIGVLPRFMADLEHCGTILKICRPHRFHGGYPVAAHPVQTIRNLL